MHYHVGNNTPGYMPDSDPYTVDTLRGAISASRGDAFQYLQESREADYGSPESERRHWTMYGRNGHYRIENDSPYYLGRVFWIQSCDDEGCSDD